MTKRTKAPTPFTLESALAMKERARKARRKLSFGEKIERMEALRERLRPFKEAREARREKTGSTAIGKRLNTTSAAPAPSRPRSSKSSRG